MNRNKVFYIWCALLGVAIGVIWSLPQIYNALKTEERIEYNARAAKPMAAKRYGPKIEQQTNTNTNAMDEK